MKQLLLAAGCAFAGLTAMAQTPAKTLKAAEKLSVSAPAYTKGLNNADRGGNRRVDVIDEIDFSGGLPAGWDTYGDVEGIPNADAIWEFRGPSTSPDNTVGSIGSCSGGGGAPISSSSADNGYMIFDSNNLDDPSDACGGNIGSGAAPVPHSGFLETSSYDLSSYSTISVSWTQSLRFLGGLLELEVSTDGGATWQKSGYAANNEYAVNEASPADAFAAVDVTSLAAGQADVKFRFAWSPNFGANVAALGYYFWMIDDISITTTPSYDAGYVHMLNYMDADGIYYGTLPLDEVRPYTTELGYVNRGAESVTVSSDIVVSLDSVDPVELLTVDNISLAPGEFSDTTTNELFTASEVGEFLVEYEALVAEGADELLFNNRLSDRFIVTENVMSQALLNSTRRRVIGTESFTDGQDDLYLGSYFTLLNERDITQIQVPIGNATQPGAIYRLYIANAADVQISATEGLPSSLDNSAFEISPNLIVNDADTTAGILTITPSVERLNLPAGEYFIALRLSSSAGAFPIDLIDDQETDRLPGQSILGLLDVWYTNGNALEIFMTVEEPANSVRTIANSTLEVAPNPATNNAIVEFDGQAGDFTVSVRNIQGQVVYTNNVVSNGSFNLNINTSAFGNGVYIVEIAGENGIATQQLVINK